MQALANQYHVEVTETWCNLTTKGYEACFSVEYDGRTKTFGHSFNDPELYWQWKRTNDAGFYDDAEEILIESFWQYISDQVADYLEDHHETESITTPKAKRDEKYLSEN
jgi:hypothetical protein